VPIHAQLEKPSEQTFKLPACPMAVVQKLSSNCSTRKSNTIWLNNIPAGIAVSLGTSGLFKSAEPNKDSFDFRSHLS
jgi:hypothetical protein